MWEEKGGVTLRAGAVGSTALSVTLGETLLFPHTHIWGHEEKQALGGICTMDKFSAFAVLSTEGRPAEMLK